MSPKGLSNWLEKYCYNWVENKVEKKALEKLGIDAAVVPSFLGKVHDYQISYKHSYKPKVYTSVSGNDFNLYEWPVIVKLAFQYPDIEFHLYGNTIAFTQSIGPINFIVHGRVPKEQMNREVREMQGALRLLPFEGFSEILAKSVLWGQWPISAIKYPHMLSVNDLGGLKFRKKSNIAGREHYIKNLNNYPWAKQNI